MSTYKMTRTKQERIKGESSIFSDNTRELAFIHE
jgi:hypothetical protein